MMIYRRSIIFRVGLMLSMLVLASMACSLGGGDDKKDSESEPTVAASITPPLTRTPIPTFTPFPTWTPSQAFYPLPTATRIAFYPTWTPFPSWTPVLPTAYPYDVRISYPVDGSLVAGYLTIVGSASHPRFLQYALEWGPHPNPTNLWYPLTGPQRRPVINGALGAWHTPLSPDGTYQIRLHLWLNDGTETFAVVTGIRISNTQPTAVPTLTPTPRPNRVPVISPIPSQQIQSGQALNIDVVTSDPDGDPLNLFVASSNAAIASTVVVSPSRITVTGITAGSVTVTVTANDNRGGLTSTAFIVTVQGQNRAPTISPILSQTIEVGQTRDLTIAASDPDGDLITVAAQSSNTAILTATAPSTNTVRIVGVSVGTANVTVTVSDGKGGQINTAFQVDVGAVNLPPTVGIIAAQSLSVGETRDVSFTASDPDGDALTTSASSDTGNVALASVTGTGVIRLSGIGAGTATVTLTVNDGVNPAVITSFNVTVAAGNQPPTVDAIAPQTMGVGENRDIGYNATDPDSDTLTASASSDNEGVVSASVTAPGVISLTASGAGTATITLSVEDGHNPAVSTTFTVSVAAVNLPPTVETIFPQTLTAGETRPISFVAVDPEGDSLTAAAVSDNEAIVSASVTAPDTITLIGNAAGTATVTLTVDDGHNATVSQPFTVEVTAANQPPSANPVSPQALGVGETLPVAYTASDPEGAALTATATSDNEGVVLASVAAPGTISLVGNGAGTATVTLSVSDGINPAVSVQFGVTVTAPNMPPSVNPVAPQTLGVGETLPVVYTASDPEGDPLTATAASDNEGVVSASVIAPGTISLVGNSGGAATVTLSVSDGVNPAVSVQFGVTVTAPNMPPSVNPVDPQTLGVGETLPVVYTASDPEGDPLTATATSDNEGVASASVTAPGTISLVGNSGGAATVTLSVSDGVNPAVSVQFGVTVTALNQNPAIQPVAPQSVSVGSSLPVTIITSDPDSDPVSLMAVSDNPGVATAVADGPSQVTVTGVTPGTANVMVDASDGKGGLASTSFMVTVTGVNNLPVIQPIGDQSLPAGQTITVPVVVMDPDGDPVVLTALSQDSGVAVATAIGTDTLSIEGIAPGVTNVDVTADDARGGVVTVTFAVTVSSVQPVFNLMDYPVLPDISPAMASSLAQLYQSGVNNFGNQGNAFSRIGDDAMDGPNFMTPFAIGEYTLGGAFAGLQGIIDVYNGTPVRPAIDPSINSFNVDSVAAGPNYGIDTLSGPAPAGPPCDAVGGGTLLSCELQATRPAIALISFSAQNVVYMTPEQFRSELQSLVSQSLTTYGVIPVLATIPAGNGYTTEQLEPYNRAIVEVATQSGVAGVPLWNLWRAMQERGIGDPNSVAPEGAGNLTDAALGYGFNIRNLTALQTLQAVRQAAGIS